MSMSIRDCNLIYNNLFLFVTMCHCDFSFDLNKLMEHILISNKKQMHSELFDKFIPGGFAK